MTPIPAMQAALEALETALPLAKEEWTVRADWNTAGMAAIAKMESALSLLRAALGEPQPVAIRYKVRNGRWRYLNLPFTKGWTFPPNLGTPEPLYASPVAAAPQGDAWQPIETAPKDGTEVILRKGNRVGAACWVKWPDTHDMDGALEHEGGESWSIGLDGDEWDDEKAPTHWMPLPPAPAALSSPTLNEHGKRG